MKGENPKALFIPQEPASGDAPIHKERKKSVYSCTALKLEIEELTQKRVLKFKVTKEKESKHANFAYFYI